MTFRPHNDSAKRDAVRELARLPRGDYAEVRLVELESGAVRVELWVTDNPDRPAVYLALRSDELPAVVDALGKHVRSNPKRFQKGTTK